MDKEKKEPESKIFNIMQYVNHPQTGVNLINELVVKSTVNKYKTITNWAYILHDKDLYTEEDDVNKKGTLKPPHFHIVLRLGATRSAKVVANWFNIPSNFVDLPFGKNAFWDCVEYLTHDNSPEKHHYDDSEIFANFNFREEVDKRKKEKKTYGKVLTDKERIRAAVTFDGKTLNECRSENPLNYMEDFEKLKKLRLQYLEHQPAPAVRINYYISGNGGVGKGLTSRALARVLFPDIEDDSDIFFEVGAEDANFEGYDGQPCIIWNDCRSGELTKKLHTRGNVFNVFDTFPTRAKQNIKYGSTSLMNYVNIVNSVQPCIEFLDGLAGEYTDRAGNKIKAEDKNQSYRRFPFLIPLHEDDFDLFVNKGFYYGDGRFSEWEEYNHIRGNLGKIRRALKDNEVLARELEAKTLALPKSKYEEVITIKSKDETELQNCLREFEDFGKIIETVSVPNVESNPDDLDDLELPF